jgi:hypothetical protein
LSWWRVCLGTTWWSSDRRRAVSGVYTGGLAHRWSSWNLTCSIPSRPVPIPKVVWTDEANRSQVRSTWCWCHVWPPGLIERKCSRCEV